MLKIYGRANYSSVQFAMWAITELGIDCSRFDYGHGHASTKTSDYSAMQLMYETSEPEPPMLKTL